MCWVSVCLGRLMFHGLKSTFVLEALFWDSLSEDEDSNQWSVDDFTECPLLFEQSWVPACTSMQPPHAHVSWEVHPRLARHLRQQHSCLWKRHAGSSALFYLRWGRKIRVCVCVCVSVCRDCDSHHSLRAIFQDGSLSNASSDYDSLDGEG